MPWPKLREIKEALTSFFSAPYTTKYPAGPAASFPSYRGLPKYDKDERVGYEFLAKHSAKNTDSKTSDNISITHTRIPDKDQNIYAGAYIIPKEELGVFYSLYYDSIFIKKRREYLTERQLDSNGPILVDFDFRYDYNVTKRLHTQEHI